MLDSGIAPTSDLVYAGVTAIESIGGPPPYGGWVRSVCFQPNGFIYNVLAYLQFFAKLCFPKPPAATSVPARKY